MMSIYVRTERFNGGGFVIRHPTMVETSICGGGDKGQKLFHHCSSLV
jgi:hypothetical protein